MIIQFHLYTNPGWIRPFLSNWPRQNSKWGKELNKFCPPNRRDDLCLAFCFHPSSMGTCNLTITKWMQCMLNIPVDKNIRTEINKKYSSKFKQKFKPKFLKCLFPLFSLLCYVGHILDHITTNSLVRCYSFINMSS